MNCHECGTQVGIFNNINGYCRPCHIKMMGLQARGETDQHYEERQRKEREEERALKAKTKNMTVTTETAHNLPVAERLGIVAGETVLGLNAFKDLFADARGLVGGNSQTMQTAMKDAREQAMESLKAEAAKMDADAVVGISIEYNDIGNGGKMMMVAATGTAVRLAEKAAEAA